jgi:hypothetical protein
LGAAFKRTVTVRAEGVPGLAIPPVPLDGEEGLHAYAGKPEVADSGDRGRLTGHRQQSVTYVCERPGTYHLPALVLVWWDPKAKGLHRERLPERTITVKPAPSVASDPPQTWPLWPVGLLLGIVGVAGVWWAWPRPTEEARRFGELAHECRAGDPHRTYRTLSAWLDAIPGAATRFATTADPELREEWSLLDQAAYGTSTPRPWSGDRFLALLQAGRRDLLQGTHRHRGSQLQPLNPGFEETGGRPSSPPSS